jgi:cytidylate kinase
MKRISIAIDGLSASGKSTLAQGIAKALNYLYVDTGAMYRAVALFALREKLIDREGQLDEEGMKASLQRVYLTFRFNPGTGRGEICLNGRNVEKEIRSHEVSKHVSVVARVPEVREKLVLAQQRMGSHGGVVMDGRDIGTVVLPEAEVKFFMTADIEARGKRRHKELVRRGRSVSFGDVLDNLRSRDRIDSTRDHSPLVQADDAIVIDNSDLTIEEQFDHMMACVQQVLNA